jgi:hypothetical protein
VCAFFLRNNRGVAGMTGSIAVFLSNPMLMRDTIYDEYSCLNAIFTSN